MKLDEIQNYVRQFINEGSEIHLYLVLKEQQEGEVKYCKYLANVESSDNTTYALMKLFTDYLKERILDNNELNTSGLEELPGLSSSDDVPGRIYVYDYALDNIPDGLVLFKDFELHKDEDENYDLDQEPKFNFKKHKLENLFGYIIHLHAGDNRCLLFKKHFNVHLIKHDKPLFGLLDDGKLEKVDGDFLKLDGKVDLLKIKDEIFVLNNNTLENHLGLKEFIKKDAEKGLEHIKKLDIVENFAVLKEHCENNFSLEKKLAKIMRTSPVVEQNISKKDIISFAKNKDSLKDKLKFNKNHILLNTTSIPVFLKLMNDSYLTSDLTKELYEAHAKDRMGKA